MTDEGDDDPRNDGDRGSARVTLLTRNACHLCGVARTAVSQACATAGHGWAEVDIDTDPELRAEYGDRVPVVLLDGAEFAALHVDREQLARALAG